MLDFTGTFIGFPQFMLYYLLGLAILAAFMFLYTKVTPYDEVALVRENNAAAALAWIGALVGYSLAISSAMRESVAVQEFLVWGAISAVSQLAVFFGYRRFYPRLRERIEAGEIATGINLAGVSIAIGLLNSAAMVE